MVPLRQMLELNPQNPSLNGVEPAVIALDIVVILPGLAMVPESEWRTPTLMVPAARACAARKSKPARTANELRLPIFILASRPALPKAPGRIDNVVRQ